MRSRVPPLAIIFAIVFIDLVGFGIVIPVLPLYATRFGASALVVGFLLASYSAMQALCAPILGRWSDRVGRRPVLLASVAGTSVGFLITGLAPTLAWLFVGRIVDGATGGNVSTALAYIADISKPQERSRRMGLIGAAFGLGFIVGPALGGIASRISPAAPFFLASALAAANACAIAAWLPESLSPEHRGRHTQHRSALALLRGPQGAHLRVVVGAYFFMTAAFSLLTATYALFTQQRFGFDAAHNGYLFAGIGLIGAVIQGGLLGPLVKHTGGDRPLAVIGAGVLTAGLFALPLSRDLAWLLWATAAIGAGHGLMAAPLNALASNASEAAAQGRAIGLMQSAASLARIVGPILGGWLLHADALRADAMFGRSPYWAGGALTLAALAFTLLL